MPSLLFIMNIIELDMIKKTIMKKRTLTPVIPPENYLSTGITLVNLALSGRHDGGVAKGTYVYFVGDSSSAKTWMCMNLMAEATLNSQFKDYQLVFDNAENGALMNIERYFGSRLAQRMSSPQGGNSETTEEFYYHLDDALKQGPCLYILDSMDSLDTKDDLEKYEQVKEAHRTGMEVSGSFGMAQAKINSRNIKRFVSRLRATGSILFVISQTRDKINSPFPMKTRAGGKALKFYSHIEIWTSVKGDIKKTVRGKQRAIGSTILVDVQKNRLTGWDAYKVEVPFFRSFGLDDIGASVDYLVGEGHWKKPDKGPIIAPEFDVKGNREDIIKIIQSEGGEEDLAKLVQTVWQDIEKSCAVERINRYTR